MIDTSGRSLFPAASATFAPAGASGDLLFRARDIALASLLLVALAPLFALIALAIRLESRGPILFRQRRGGLHGASFVCLKFRSMTVCEDGDVVRQATTNDPRTTAVGRVLRRMSLDELPQLLNVLSGEMSLVGPRPHALAHDRIFAARILQYKDRALVKPGITGLAQISGLRGECAQPEDMAARVRTDIEYIRRRTFVLDLKILLLTLPRVLLGKNAW